MQRGEAVDLLVVQRQQQQRGGQRDHGEEHQHGREAEGPVAEQAHVHDRLGGA
jgi:hypothetical protein